MTYAIYKIVCSPNNRTYYGRSSQLERRWRIHKNMFKSNTHYNSQMQEDWNKYGEERFLFEVLEIVGSEEESIKKEQELIDASIGVSYNISNAISGGDTFTNNPRKEEIRRKHSLRSSGKGNGMYGREKSEVFLKSIKKANSKSVIIENEIYPSLTEASKALGVKISTINFRINSVSDRFKNWTYVDKEKPNDYRNQIS